MRQLSLGRSLLWLVVSSVGLAGPLWAQEPTPVGPIAATPESAPQAPSTKAPPPAATPEPGSALAALLTPPVAVESAQPLAADERPTSSGFVVGASLGLSLAVATGSTSPQPSLQPGLAIGAKLGRAVLTLGAEFTNLGVSATTIARDGTIASRSQTNSSLLVVPGLQVAMVRSRDGRVELLGAARIGFGAPTSGTNQTPAVPATPTTLSTSQFNFMYEVGPGVRYWPHPHFALNLLAGFRGDYLFQSTTGTFPTDPSVTVITKASNTGLNGIFASIGGMGAF